MASNLNFNITKGLLILSVFLLLACNSTKQVTLTTPETPIKKVATNKASGGSSGMEQLNDTTYLVVYDLKNFEEGIRLGLLIFQNESIEVFPIEIDAWGAEGISSDLESISAVPGRTNQFIIAESGNWQGSRGRIFHIEVDVKTLKAKILSTLKYPMLYRNDIGLRGDQYEAVHCLPYSETERIIMLGERGGSKVSPLGVIRWGLWDMQNNTLNIEGAGLKGINIDAPGNWLNTQSKRSISDFHVDDDGIIWTTGSQDPGDIGPFYSVIYKLGKVNSGNPEEPVTIFDTLNIEKEIHGFKVEALSGPTKAIDCTHTFGTEDENYGGVWRPIHIGHRN